MSAIEKLRDDINAKFGENSAMIATDVPVRRRISSGSMVLDFAVGNGGMPSDRVIEIAGAEGGGKTTLGLLILCQFLDAQPNRYAIILDMENKLTMKWVEELIGTDRMKRVMLVWPDHIEQATDIYIKAVSSGLMCFAMLDSIGGAPSMRATENSAEKAEFGGNSVGVGKFARAAATHSNKYECLTVGINQVREDMSGYHQHKVPGGKAWVHACSLRIKLRKGKDRIEDKVNGEAVQVGFNVVAKIIKNQLGGIENREAWWWFFNVPTDKYGFGVDTTEELIRLSTLTGVVDRSGAWYVHPALDGGKVQGMAKLQDAVKGSASIRDTLISETLAALQGDTGLAEQIAPIVVDDE